MLAPFLDSQEELRRAGSAWAETVLRVSVKPLVQQVLCELVSDN